MKPAQTHSMQETWKELSRKAQPLLQGLVHRFLGSGGMDSLYARSSELLGTTKQWSSRVAERRYLQEVAQSELRIRRSIAFRRWLGYPVPITVVFLAELPEIWHSVASVYTAMRADSRFNPIVVAVPTRDLAERTNCPRYVHHCAAFLKEQGIPFHDGETVDLSSFEPDLFFIPTPFDEKRPPSFQMEALRKLGRVAYVPYGFEIGAYQEFQFNTVVHNSCWRIFSRSERHRALYARYTQVGAEHVVVTGHPKLDPLLASPRLLRPYEAPRRVIWAPHFDVRADGTGWSTFLKYKDHFLAFAGAHPEVEIVVRPHPYLFRTLRERDILSEQEVERFIQTVRSRPNMSLHQHPDYYALFRESDGLVTDCSSFLFEYIPTGAPIFYLENELGPGVNEEGELMSAYYAGRDWGSVSEFLQMVIRREDPRQEERMARQRAFLHLPGHGAGTEICEYLGAEFGY
jgi:hypothetical protein